MVGADDTELDGNFVSAGTNDMRYLSLLLTFVALAPQTGTKVTIKIQDASGAPLKDELVIVQDLNKPGTDLLRALSDQNGDVPLLELGHGVFRVIATYPYRGWKTQVSEFLVRDKPITVSLQIQPMPTHGYGDVVTVGSSFANLQVVRSDGQPASGASVLVRDEDNTLFLERSYKTDEKGMVKIELVGDPTVVVVVYGDALVTQRLPSGTSNRVVRLSKN